MLGSHNFGNTIEKGRHAPCATYPKPPISMDLDHHGPSFSPIPITNRQEHQMEQDGGRGAQQGMKAEARPGEEAWQWKSSHS